MTAAEGRSQYPLTFEQEAVWIAEHAPAVTVP